MPHPGLPQVLFLSWLIGGGGALQSRPPPPIPIIPLHTLTQTRRRSRTKPTTCSPADGVLFRGFPIWKDKFAPQPRLVGHLCISLGFYARFPSLRMHSRNARKGYGDRGLERDRIGEKKRRPWQLRLMDRAR
ncbi:hypothetical protein LZ31DRAFT_91362 [Colletotrichum somersetense]|nr:hypothetical protein LZ31DRAFT_91362 [Colletotrichum somersetense]